MASNSKQTEAIRKAKRAPNKANLKTQQKRLAKNVQVLRQLARENRS
jgi:hypothetical protein